MKKIIDFFRYVDAGGGERYWVRAEQSSDGRLIVMSAPDGEELTPIELIELGTELIQLGTKALTR